MMSLRVLSFSWVHIFGVMAQKPCARSIRGIDDTDRPRLQGSISDGVFDLSTHMQSRPWHLYHRMGASSDEIKRAMRRFRRNIVWLVIIICYFTCLST